MDIGGYEHTVIGVDLIKDRYTGAPMVTYRTEFTNDEGKYETDNFEDTLDKGDRL